MVKRIGGFVQNNAIGVVALVVALGGTSYAVTEGFASKNGRLNGCVGGGGVLHLVKPHHRCGRGETRVSWSIVGPRGKQGTPGSPGQHGSPGQNGQSVVSSSLPSGDASCPNGGASFHSASGTTFACNGATGARGPSDAYTATNGNLLRLSAGSYVVFADVTFHTTNAAVGTLSCHLDDSTSSSTLDSGSEQIPATSGWNAHLAFVVPLTLSATHSIGLGCSASGGTGSFTLFQNSAIQVDTLHTQ